MKNGILCLLLACAVAMGYLLGRHSVTQSRPSAWQRETSSLAHSNTVSNGSEKESPAATGKLSLMEIEERIRGLKISEYRWGTGAPRAWLDLFQQISADDMPEVLNFVSKNCAANIQRVLQKSLFSQWADIDPRGALNFANHLSNKEDRRTAMSIIISDWSANDPTAAAAWAKQLPAGSFRIEVLHDVISGMAASDPRGALDLYQSSGANSGTFDFPFQLLGSIFGAWTAKNPMEAAQAAAQLPFGDRRLAREIIASTWAAMDSPAAMDWARTIPNIDDKNLAMQNILSQWSRTDPASVAEWIRQMPEGSTKQNMLIQIERQLAVSDPKFALELAQSLKRSDFAKENLIRDAVAKWAQQDEAGALAYAQNLPSGAERVTALTSVLNVMSAHDPKAALSLLSQLPQGQAQVEVINGIANGLAQTDPQAAVTFAVQNLTAQGQLNIFMHNMANNWAGKDLNAAKNFWQNVPEGPTRDSFMEGLVSAIVENSVQDAATYISGLPGHEQSRAIGTLMTRWSADDPESAAKWVASLNDPHAQASAYQDLLVGWAHSDPARASEWLSALPENESRQNLAQTFVSYVGFDRPELAAPWAASLTDADERNKAIQRVAASWLQTDADSAKAWLATTSLPDNLKQMLLNN
jgi:hypothetical protein